MAAVVLAAAVLPNTPADDRLKIATQETESGAYADAIRDANAAAAAFAAKGDTHGRAVSINLAGRAAQYSGDYQTAARSFNTAYSLATSIHDDALRAEALSNLGNTNYFTGRYSDAAAQYASALAITNARATEAWAPRRRRIILVNQATLDQRLGRDEEALKIYREVQATGSDLRPQEQAQILTNLGVLYRHLGDPIKALAAYDQARALFAQEHQLDGELGVMKNRGIVLALDLGQLDAAQKNFTESLDKATQAANKREMLQARLYRGETELRAGEADAARADFTAALELAQSLHTPEEQWKALYRLGRLDEAITVIENIREGIRVPSLRSDYFNDKREVYDALIAREMQNGSAVRVFELIERSKSRAWRDRLGLKSFVQLRDVQRALPADALLLDYWKSPAGSAMVAIWPDRVSLTTNTLPDITAAVHHVIIVPDGALALLPFEALQSGNQLLIEKAAVSYLPTAAMLLRPVRAATVGPPWRRILRAFADPRLPSTGDEARSIANELGGRAEIHAGGDDRKSYLHDVTSSAPLLHIASHAVADENALEQSRILFSSGGDLYLREAYELPLRGVALAVLSACDTERGKVTRGEGVQSFSRAFLAAGAQSTVTTLWRVADQPTASFMKVFYHHLQRGEPRDEALRQAKLRFLHSGNELADPRYWAAFVLTGEAMEPVPRAMRWSTIVLIAIALVAVIALITYVSSRSSHFSTDGGV